MAEIDNFVQSLLINSPNISAQVSANPSMSDFINVLKHPITIEFIRIYSILYHT